MDFGRVFGPADRWLTLILLQRRFCENRAPVEAKLLFLRFRACKKRRKIEVKLISKKLRNIRPKMSIFGAVLSHQAFSKFKKISKYWPSAVQKIIKNCPRCSKGGFWRALWTHVFRKVDLGKVWAGFWKDFRWNLKVADHIVDSYFAQCRYAKKKTLKIEVVFEPMWDKL